MLTIVEFLQWPPKTHLHPVPEIVNIQSDNQHGEELEERSAPSGGTVCPRAYPIEARLPSSWRSFFEEKSKKVNFLFFP